MGRYLELTKPRITLFILMSTAIGFVCGMNAGGPWTWVTLLHTLVGTALIASGYGWLAPQALPDYLTMPMTTALVMSMVEELNSPVIVDRSNPTHHR